jgi:hypothetical protein
LAGYLLFIHIEGDGDEENNFAGSGFGDDACIYRGMLGRLV